MDNQQQRLPKGKNVQRLNVLYLMNYIVYLTTNRINGKKYCGVHCTKDPDVFDGYYGSGVDVNHKVNNRKNGLPAAIRKYGKENFIRETLFIFPYSEEGKIQAYKKEEEIVNEAWIKDPMTYNLVLGGMIPNVSDINSKTVYQFALNGDLIKVWKSASLASKEFENENAARVAIQNVCNKITRQAYGYYWSYKRHFEYNPYNGCKSVAAYKDSGEFIHSFSSLKEAAKYYSLNTCANIIACIKGTQKHCAGVRWRYFYGSTSNINPL